jgi:microcystin-dependent protein
MANYEATKYDFDAANLQDIEGIPTATIIPWSDSTAPAGYLECNGSGVSRTTYSALFAIIGTTYGSGNGSTTFNVPDLQDNVAVSKSGTKALGSTGGANTATTTGNVAGSTANHSLTSAELASHSHPKGIVSKSPQSQVNPGPSYPIATPTNSGNTGSGSGHSHNMSANFTGDATSIVQPYLTVMYIIKT